MLEASKPQKSPTHSKVVAAFFHIRFTYYVWSRFVAADMIPCASAFNEKITSS